MHVESKRVEDFLTECLGSQGNERANYQTLFFGDLAVPVTSGQNSEDGDLYYFDNNIKFFSEKAEMT
jgi:hypothetical protein